tara:strand:+ start:389 stop:895 length:507 start_codon:yes stop_codon:yes gene_type:complete
MNIFYFYDCPKACAEAQPDKMLVKMPLETAQMLCTAHRVLDGDEYADANGLYKEAYKNHPCTIWARKTSGNYAWLYEHFDALCWEYTHRYGKTHASGAKLMDALSKVPDNIEQGEMTPVALAMPDQYKEPDDPILSYRQYCIAEKHYAQWNKSRPRPVWWPTPNNWTA